MSCLSTCPGPTSYLVDSVQPKMRAIPRPLAARTAFSPIETIVFVFVLATLAYFHILSAIRDSTYFVLSTPTTLRPAYALLTNQEWVSVSDKDWFKARIHPQRGYTPVELQSIIFSLEDSKVTRYHIFCDAALTRCTGHGCHRFPRAPLVTRKHHESYHDPVRYPVRTRVFFVLPRSFI